jgi:hypothetical protein
MMILLPPALTRVICPIGARAVRNISSERGGARESYCRLVAVTTTIYSLRIMLTSTFSISRPLAETFSNLRLPTFKNMHQ